MNSPRTATDTGYSPLLLITVRDVSVIMLTMSILSKVSSHHTRLPSKNENKLNPNRYMYIRILDWCHIIQ